MLGPAVTVETEQRLTENDGAVRLDDRHERRAVNPVRRLKNFSESIC
jgi:hypothetical protein